LLDRVTVKSHLACNVAKSRFEADAEKIFTIFQTESALPPTEMNSAAPAEEDGFQRFMQEYANQQGTAVGTTWNESARPDIRPATPGGKRRL
jgi:hypothetical protein